MDTSRATLDISTRVRMPPVGHVWDRCYMLFRDLDIAMIVTHKAASSAVKNALRRGFGSQERTPDFLPYVAKEEIRSASVRIGFIRNPYKRLESCYADKWHLRRAHGFLTDFEEMGFRKSMTFPQFVKRVCELPDAECRGDGKHFRSLQADLCDGEGVIPNEIVRFEDLNAGWQRVRELFQERGGVRLPKLMHLRKSNHRVAKWTPEARAMASHRFAGDFEAFGYDR